jgi:hypothetical protein
MKKLLWIAFTLFSQQIFAVTAPAKYGLLEKNDGVTTYKHRNEKIYAIVVDTSKANIIFGGTMDYDSEDTYRKGSIQDHWDRHSSSQTVAVLNGGFFDRLGWPNKNYTTAPAKLVFPTKSDYSVISSGVHDPLATRSLIVNSSGKVFIREGFNRTIFNSSNVKEYLTGLKPDTNKSPDEDIGRNYIGGIPKNNCDPSTQSCEYSHIIFFIADSANHYDMISQLTQWNVPSKSQIMMDGSDSAQMILQSFDGSFTKQTTLRKIPHSIIIENK